MKCEELGKNLLVRLTRAIGNFGNGRQNDVLFVNYKETVDLPNFAFNQLSDLKAVEEESFKKWPTSHRVMTENSSSTVSRYSQR